MRRDSAFTNYNGISKAEFSLAERGYPLTDDQQEKALPIIRQGHIMGRCLREIARKKNQRRVYTNGVRSKHGTSSLPPQIARTLQLRISEN